MFIEQIMPLAHMMLLLYWYSAKSEMCNISVAKNIALSFIFMVACFMFAVPEVH
jgi:hypothetical protein